MHTFFRFFEAKEAVEVIEVTEVIMSIEVIETPEFFRTTQGFEINKLMAKISLLCCFGKKILNRMMKFQVKFCHPLELRLWRTEMLLLTKSKGHKSNAVIWEHAESYKQFLNSSEPI